MQKIFNKLMDRIGVPALLVTFSLLVVSGSMLYAKDAMAGYLYRNFTSPFLAQTSATIHASKIEPINKLLKK